MLAIHYRNDDDNDADQRSAWQIGTKAFESKPVALRSFPCQPINRANPSKGLFSRKRISELLW